MSHCVKKEDRMKELCINMHDGDEENVCDDIINVIRGRVCEQHEYVPHGTNKSM